MKKKKFFVERTAGDDILDALSIRINQTLKTEKKIDDKKNNVYFWLFKFIILIIYLLFINLCFDVVKDLGIALIYYFGTTLRSMFSFTLSFIMEFTKGIIILYVLFKNLKIFMNSTYYNRLYSKDRTMQKKKNKFFKIIYLILKYLSVPYLVITAFSAAIILSITTALLYLTIKGMYSIGALLITILLFTFFYYTFRAIQNKFFNSEVLVTKKHFYVIFILLLVSTVIFGFEINSYDYSDSLPSSFVLEKKERKFDISEVENISIKSNAKYKNIDIYTDNSLDGEIRIEITYFNTANVSYNYFFNSNDDLLLKFNSTINFEIDNVEDLLKLGVETLRTKTLYNYNLFKYPIISIYANQKDMSKISIIKYNEALKSQLYYAKHYR